MSTRHARTYPYPGNPAVHLRCSWQTHNVRRRPRPLYGVTTFNLNKAVARNRDRFPKDFAFKLTLEETRALIFQTGISRPDGPKAMMFQPGTSKPGHGGTRKPATVFTEQGVAMLASVLRSPRAVLISVAIVRAFVRLRSCSPAIGGWRQNWQNWK